MHYRQPGIERGRLRGLQGVDLVSSLDRTTIAPMLLVIAADLRVSVAEVTVVASVYYLTYGLMQPVCGIVAARVGTVRTLRLTFAGAGIVGFASAFAPDVLTLTVLRSIAGGLFAAATPPRWCTSVRRCRSSGASNRWPTSWRGSLSAWRWAPWRPAGRPS